jgi:hypothetical protein
MFHLYHTIHVHSCSIYHLSCLIKLERVSCIWTCAQVRVCGSYSPIHLYWIGLVVEIHCIL